MVPTASFSHIGEKYAVLLAEVLPGWKVEFVSPREIPPGVASCESLSRKAPVNCSAYAGDGERELVSE